MQSAAVNLKYYFLHLITNTYCLFQANSMLYVFQLDLEKFTICYSSLGIMFLIIYNMNENNNKLQWYEMDCTKKNEKFLRRLIDDQNYP